MLETPAELLDRLEQCGLLTPSIIERREAMLGAESAEQAAEELVRLRLLTEYQAQAAVNDASQPLSIGDYIVEDMIGRGGMGFVLKASHRRMKRQVAIKFLHKSMTESRDLVARFEREFEAAAQLHHQNIVTAYDAGEHDGSHYLVMQYVDGEDLSHRVKHNGPLRVSEAIDVIRQTAEGLGYAHDKGIVHRDIKPGNLLLDREGVVRILDMGLARMRPSPGDALDGGAHADLTNTGSVMGTVDYMAPEQALDAKTADFSADIYSLGCTLYFLLTGNPPFRSDTIMRRLLAHREQDIPLIRHVRPEAPRELDGVFAKMMAKKKEDRYPSMQHLVVALKSIELDDDEAEQMATLDAPDDGTGGFISLPEADQPDDSGASGFSELSATTPGEGLARDSSLSATEATLIESDSQLSQTVVTSSAESLSQASGFPDSPANAATPSESPHTARHRSSSPWKVVIPGIATVLLVAILFALSQKGTDGPPTNGSLADAGAQSESKADAAQRQGTARTATADSSLPEMSPDRRAAEWVLSIGGNVSAINEAGKTLDISNRAPLPPEPFQVNIVDIAQNAKVGDEELKKLRGLSGLTHLSIWGTSISDQGLANLTNEGRLPLPNLLNLSLGETEITEAGLGYLAGSRQLAVLNISDTRISDLSVLPNFPQLSKLDIRDGQIAAEALAELKAIKTLKSLTLDGTQVADLGSQHTLALGAITVLNVQCNGAEFDPIVFQGLDELADLQLISPPNSLFVESFWMTVASLPKLTSMSFANCLTNETLAGLQPMPQLRKFHLGFAKASVARIPDAAEKLPNLIDLANIGAELTDNDALQLQKFSRLTQLDVTVNQITAVGIEKLRKALPACRIISDHGTFEPDPAVMSPDRRAVDWVFAQGGSVRIQTDGESPTSVQKVAELPSDGFRLLDVDLSRCKHAIDDGLSVLQGLSSLDALYLVETQVTDQGLANLTDEGRLPLTNLKRLYLDGTRVSESGLRHLAGSKALQSLLLSKTQVVDWSVLKLFPRLGGLSIDGARDDSTALAEILNLPALVQLKVDASHLAIAAGQHPDALRRLEDLTVYNLTSDFDVSELSNLRKVRALGLQNSDPRVIDADFWRTVAGLPELTSLYFAYGIDVQ